METKQALLPGIGLPTSQTIEGWRLSKMKWLLYGPPGIGKSTFFSKAVEGARAPLFLHTDPGLRGIKAYKAPITSWGQFKTIAKALVAQKPTQYSMVVLDTIDILFRMCRKAVCEKRGIEHVSDEEWGKGYDMVKDEFEQSIAPLALLDQAGIGLAFISHSKDVEVRGRTVRTNRIIPTLPKQGHDIVAPMCDVIGYCGFTVEKADKGSDGLGRIVQFEPDETVEAKDRTGLLPARCALDFDEVRQYLEDDAVKVAEVEETEEAEAPKPTAKSALKKKRKA